MNNQLLQKNVMRYCVQVSESVYKHKPFKKMFLSCVLFDKMILKPKKTSIRKNVGEVVLIESFCKKYESTLCIGNIDRYFKVIREEKYYYEKLSITNLNEIFNDFDNIVKIINLMEDEYIIRRFILHEV